IKIISTPPLDKPYNVALYLKPIGVADWKNFGEYTDQNPKNLEFSGVQYLPDLTPYKYAVFIEVTSGDIKIRSETRVFEIKSQPTKKPEEFQVIVVGVNPKQAQYMSQGVRIGTVVDYELEIKGGEPRFEIKTIVINPDNTTRDPRTDSSDSRDFAYWDKPLFPGATKVNIAVKDKTGKTAKTQIVIFAK
ncbi:MAG: hypothetical protein Q8R04_05965, partial [Nanoarchaeota archaeon]|nr:hypothetical protein [Nanoarchaeota archaeon]